MFPAAPAIDGAHSVAGTEVIRSGALADVPPNHAQPLVTVGPDRRVLFGTLANNGSVVESPTVIDPGPRGTTVGSPDIAVGDDGFGERVFAVWTAEEQSTTAMMQLRWGLREIDGGAWQLFEGIATSTSRVGAGFDPTSSTWLIASLSSAGEPLISVIEPSGAPLLAAEPVAVRRLQLLDRPRRSIGVACGVLSGGLARGRTSPPRQGDGPPSRLP